MLSGKIPLFWATQSWLGDQWSRVLIMSIINVFMHIKFPRFLGKCNKNSFSVKIKFLLRGLLWNCRGLYKQISTFGCYYCFRNVCAKNRYVKMAYDSDISQHWTERANTLMTLRRLEPSALCYGFELAFAFDMWDKLNSQKKNNEHYFTPKEKKLQCDIKMTVSPAHIVITVTQQKRWYCIKVIKCICKELF